MTLDDGIRFRLGTQRPSRTIMSMNEIQVSELPHLKNYCLELVVVVVTIKTQLTESTHQQISKLVVIYLLM